MPYFLYCQAIELGLKAFLLWKGLGKRELAARPLGHNPTNLLQRCRADGLNGFVCLDALEEEALVQANGYYDSGASGKRFQYFDVMMALTGFKGLPAQLLSAAWLRRSSRTSS